MGSVPGKNLSTAANGGWQQRFSFFPLCISCLIRGPLSSFPLHYISLVLLCLILAHRVCECVCVEREVQRALGGHQRLSERIKDPANLGKLGTRTHSLSLSAKSFLARILATSVLSFVSMCVFSTVDHYKWQRSLGWQMSPLHGPPFQSLSILFSFRCFSPSYLLILLLLGPN